MEKNTLGLWVGDTSGLAFDDDGFRAVLNNTAKPVYVIEYEGKMAMTNDGEAAIAPDGEAAVEDCFPLYGMVPPLTVPFIRG